MGAGKSQFTEEELQDYQVKLLYIYSCHLNILLAFSNDAIDKILCFLSIGSDVLYKEGSLTVSTISEFPKQVKMLIV